MKYGVNIGLTDWEIIVSVLTMSAKSCPRELDTRRGESKLSDSDGPYKSVQETTVGSVVVSAEHG